MRKQINTDDKNLLERGFTLIELLVVIVILGLLAAVVVFAVGGITDKGKGSACKIETREVNTAIQAYRANDPNNNLPASLGALVPGFLDSVPSATSASGPGSYSGGVYTPSSGKGC